MITATATSDLFELQPREASVLVSNFTFNGSKRERHAYMCSCGTKLIMRCAIEVEGTVFCNGCKRRMTLAIEA